MYRPLRTTRKRGCLYWLFLLFGATFGCCIVSTMTYIFLPPPPLTLLIMGIDARAGEGSATRTDSIMLVGFQPDGLRASVLSIPRDLMINTPNYGIQRINAIHVLGEMESPGYGPELLQESIALSKDINSLREL